MAIYGSDVNLLYTSDNVTTNETKSSEENKTFVYSAAFVCTVLIVAVIFHEFLKKLQFPSSVLLFAFGSALGVFDHHFESFREFTVFAKMNTGVQLFLPIIIYEFAFGMNPHMFLMAIGQCLILALPGFAFCTVLNAFFAKIVLYAYQWNWNVCLLFGGILSASDPSAVMELLTDHGVSSSLTTIIKGESMLNSGIALVFSHIVQGSMDGQLGVENVLLDFVQTCLGSVAFGYVIAMGAVALLRQTENDTDMEVTFTFCISYITYFISEVFLGMSGILAVVVLGVSVSNYKSSINYEEEETTVHQFWQTLSFWANSLIFTNVGLIITSSVLKSFDASDIGFVISTYFVVTVFRGFMIVVLTPFLKGRGYGFTWKYGVVLTWGGLRGAVGLAIVYLGRFRLPPEVQDKLLTQVSGVIVLTLIFNSTSMHLLLKLLGMARNMDKNMTSMVHAVALLQDAVNTTEKVIRMDKYLSGVDWVWVHQVTRIENPYDDSKKNGMSKKLKCVFNAFRGRCSECSAEIRIEPNAEELERMKAESRLITLRALEASVANQHSGYGIQRRTLGHLNTCIDNAIDVRDKYLLAEDVKKKFLTTNVCVKLLKTHMMRGLKRLNIHQSQNKTSVRLRTEEPDSSPFRKWCISIYLNRQFEPILYWALLFNVVPTGAEFATLFTSHGFSRDMEHLKRNILVFEAFQAILALFYVFDAVVRMGVFGCKSYFQSKDNVVDFVVTATAATQMIFAIFLLFADPNTLTRGTLIAIVSLGAVRLVRLLKITLTGIFTNILDQFCSVFYNAFDLAIGFIVANEEIAKSAHSIIEYAECADYAQLTAENNIYNMLCYLNELENEHPGVACAWRTHRATVYTLRNMRNIVEEMVNIYMIDEGDAEQLHDEIDLKLKDTLIAPRFIPAKEDVRNTLKSIQWILNDEILERILANHSIQSLISGQVIQDPGKEHTDLKIIHKGIVQVGGINSGEKTGVLPNTDSLWYFNKSTNFSVQLTAPETIGILGYLTRTPSVTSATCSKDSQLISIKFETVEQIEMTHKSMSFYMWRPLALQIAFSVVSKEEAYENWSHERLKIYLEESILPDLENTVELNVHPVIADMVLVQGTTKDKATGTVYVGPAYIPHSVRSLILVDNTQDRPRVVMVLLREERYHARAMMGWIRIDEITYKGLCLVHGIRNLHNTQLNETVGCYRRSFLHTLGHIFKPKSILRSDEP